jgi:hypothetical protein
VLAGIESSRRRQQTPASCIIYFSQLSARHTTNGVLAIDKTIQAVSNLLTSGYMWLCPDSVATGPLGSTVPRSKPPWTASGSGARTSTRRRTRWDGNLTNASERRSLCQM